MDNKTEKKIIVEITCRQTLDYCEQVLLTREEYEELMNTDRFDCLSKSYSILSNRLDLMSPIDSGDFKDVYVSEITENDEDGE